MKVKCVICDKVESIENESLQAKRLRNRPIHTFMCKDCDERIAEKTKVRLDSGKFQFNRPKTNEDEW
ncbi:YlaI family protein [Bacillus sp. CGMCC 1.16607]|uniref:YlaI family protein n=1 Tax=Bacillus sp. CGMCC 1.16607 TaxID=3351842 RepID=UPI003641928B